MPLCYHSRRLRCRVEAVEGTSVAPASNFYVGQLGAPTTAVLRSSGTGWSGWTAFNATHANSTMKQYPNWAGHEALFGPYPMLVTRLIVSPHLPHVPGQSLASKCDLSPARVCQHSSWSTPVGLHPPHVSG